MSSGCLKVHIPREVFLDLNLMTAGQDAIMTGSCQRNGGKNAEEVKITAERDQTHFTFSFHAKSMASVFKSKLEDTYQCWMQSLQNQLDPSLEKSCNKVSKSTVACDPLTIMAAAVQVAMEIKQKTETETAAVGNHGTEESVASLEEPNIVRASKNSDSGTSRNSSRDIERTAQSSDDDVEMESEHESEIDNDLEEALAVADQEVTITLQGTSSDEESLVTESTVQVNSSKESLQPKPNSLPITDTECYICGREWFPSYMGFKRHITHCQRWKKNGHNINETHPFCCEVCKMRFKTKRSMQLHRRDVHDLDDMGRKAPKVQPPDAQSCNFCGDFFDKNVNIDIHQRFHCRKNPEAAKPHYCSKCTDVFPSPAELEKHRLLKHPSQSSESKGFGKRVCPSCGLLFTSKSGLYMHTIQYHMGDTHFRHPCTVCGKKFVTLGKLERHITKHSDNRNFTCDKCGKTFKQQGHLSSHYRQVHENRYPYHCNLCGHGVAKKKYLESHICGRVRRIQDQEETSELTSVIETSYDDTITGSSEAGLMDIPDIEARGAVELITRSNAHSSGPPPVTNEQIIYS